MLLGSSAVLAHSSADESIRHTWQNHVHSNTLGNHAKKLSLIRKEGTLLIPFYIGLYGISNWLPPTAGFPTQRFSEQALRILALGAPLQIGLTHAIGGDRPCNSSRAKWHPFQANRGVSGHAFFGAVPILALSNTVSHPYLKHTLTLLSVLPALGRIEEDKHYFSQVLLGWGLAYQAARFLQQNDPNSIAVQVVPTEKGAMVQVHGNF